MSAELLQFIRNYSHDFQNHLQVISGLAQLNRTERIREYIGQVSGQIREITKIVKTPSPEVATALLAFQQQAVRYGIPLVFDIKTELDGWPVAGDEIRSLLVQAFADIGVLLAFLEGISEPVTVTVVGADNKFIFRVELPVTGDASVKGLEESLAQVNMSLEPFEGRASVLVEKSSTRIFLVFPRREE
ncbi:MAG: Spo0B domain-containing protein [Candidatus Desulforudis sp.]|nr:Spo0B domain-containing protein [Desulforudis sp.]